MSVTDKNLAPETAPAVPADVLKEALQAAEEAERNLPATEPRKNEEPVQTLSASGLMKRYGSRCVVKDVSVAVKSGEVVGLLGPNGAGKTTSFYMIVGLVPPNGGKIELNGIDITHLPIFRRARLGVSYLPQEASVFRRLSVEDNIRAVLELQTDEKGRAISKKKSKHVSTVFLRNCRLRTSAPTWRFRFPAASAAVRKLHAP